MIRPQTALLFPGRNSETSHMSLIHEALQKAEAERRSGELPPLLSVTRPAEARTPSRAPLWLLVPLVLVAAAVGYSNRGLIRDTLVGSKPVAQSPSASSPAPVTETPVDTEVARNPGSELATAASPPARVVPSVSESAEPAPAPAVAASPAQKPQSIAEPPASTPTPAAPEPAVVPAPVIAEPIASPPAETVTPVDATPEPPVAVADVPSPPEPTTASPGPAETPEAPSSAAVPFVFELPLGTRQALPALKVTMHVYNADPARRFAIIDGKRVNEGGILGNDLNVIEIQRDAILIDFRGTRFLLPRIGR